MENWILRVEISFDLPSASHTNTTLNALTILMLADGLTANGALSRAATR